MQFSVVIPTLNEESNIGRCLDSVLNVEWPGDRFEVVVVDNGSADRTLAIAREKGAIVLQYPKSSISGLRNLGVQNSHGTWLAFIDADCTVDKTWLIEAARYIDEESIVCFGSPPSIPEKSTWVQRAWLEVRKKSTYSGETEWLESMNMFVRREAFEKIGGFDESLQTCEDYDISVRLKSIGRIITGGRIMAIHHGEARTLSHFLQKEFWRGTSNLEGVQKHGMLLKEMPSIGVPIIYLLTLITTIALLMTSLFGHDLIHPTHSALPLVLFEAGILAIAIARCRTARNPIITVQLWLLLNIYFLARACALARFMFRKI
jgi:GT2 family glycosyltransferase